MKRGRKPQFAWTPELDAAFFEDIANGVSVRQAARNHGIPESAGDRRMQTVRESYGEQGR